jgi:hypothetical protein
VPRVQEVARRHVEPEEGVARAWIRVSRERAPLPGVSTRTSARARTGRTSSRVLPAAPS